MRPMRILVVDDDPMVRSIVRTILATRDEFQIVGLAADVPEARIMVAAARPDLMILDLQMPCTSGLDYLDELRGPGKPRVVMVSSMTPAGSVAEENVLSRGAIACFDKRRLVQDADAFLRTLAMAA